MSTSFSQSRSLSQTDLLELARSAMQESARVKQATAEQCGPAIVEASQRLAECFRRGGKALLFGNGGSASDAQHIAAEWVGRYVDDRPALPALALTANTSAVTAISNDYGFEELFVRGIAAHGRPGDVAIAISTSGNSPNVLLGVEAARERGLFTVGLSGRSGGKLAAVAEISIVVPSDETPRIQESHIAVGHVICELVELELLREHHEKRGDHGALSEVMALTGKALLATGEYQKATAALEKANTAIREAKKDITKVAKAITSLAKAVDTVGKVAALAA